MYLLKDRGFIHAQAADITPQSVYTSRRDVLKHLGTGLAGAALASWSARDARAQMTRPGKLAPLAGARSAVAGGITMDKLTPYSDVTSYNNYYEFGTDKSDPAKSAHTLKTRPWTVAIEGEVKKPGIFDLDDLLKLAPMEERIYRLRCVEGWSMVIPWMGYSLSELIKRVEPNGNAKYVEFVTLADPKTMPFVGSRVLDWPYVEGLRMDEAMHPLALLTFFAWPGGRRGRPGLGQVTAASLSVAPNALEFWRERLTEHGAMVGASETRFGETVLPFHDPDGLRLELVPAGPTDLSPLLMPFAASMPSRCRSSPWTGRRP